MTLRTAWRRSSTTFKLTPLHILRTCKTPTRWVVRLWMCFGNGYFATDKPPLLYSANQQSWFAIYKIGGLDHWRFKSAQNVRVKSSNCVMKWASLWKNKSAGVRIYTFGQLKRRFYISWFGSAESQNITKAFYQSRSNRLPKDIQRRRPQESAFRMSKGVRMCNCVKILYYGMFCPILELCAL